MSERRIVNAEITLQKLCYYEYERQLKLQFILFFDAPINCLAMIYGVTYPTTDPSVIYEDKKLESLIHRFNETVGVQQRKELESHRVRLKISEGNRVISIGHFEKDEWFSPDDEFSGYAHNWIGVD